MCKTRISILNLNKCKYLILVYKEYNKIPLIYNSKHNNHSYLLYKDTPHKYKHHHSEDKSTNQKIFNLNRRKWYPTILISIMYRKKSKFQYSNNKPLSKLNSNSDNMTIKTKIFSTIKTWNSNKRKSIENSNKLRNSNYNRYWITLSKC